MKTKKDINGSQFHFGRNKLLVRNEEFFVFYATFIAGEHDKLRLRKGDVVIDAGANIGDFTVKAARKVGPEGLVIAIEPMPQLVKFLRHNINLNQLDNVVVIEAALSSHNGVNNMQFEGVGSRISSEGQNHVNVKTIDSLLLEHNIRNVDVLKMDIEGSEYEALKDQNFLSNVREISIELHGIQNINGVERILDEEGFNLNYFTTKQLIFNVLVNGFKHLPSFIKAEYLSGFLGLRGMISLITEGNNPVPALSEEDFIRLAYAVKNS